MALVSGAKPRPQTSELDVEAFVLNTHGTTLGNEIERVCVENELVITTWSPIHLRARLQELYWKPERPAIEAMVFWENTMQYLYLPRLKNRDVFAKVIMSGADSRDFFGTAYGQTDGKFDGFKLGDANVQLDDTLLLIEPEAAKQYEAENQTPDPDIEPDPTPDTPPTPDSLPPAETPPKDEQTSTHTSFIGTANVNPPVAKDASCTNCRRNHQPSSKRPTGTGGCSAGNSGRVSQWRFRSNQTRSIRKCQSTGLYKQHLGVKP